LSTKKRVYELAKEYGMTGQELAAKLKELGVSDVKGHMTALDEFQLLKVQGTLEAYGIIPESRGEASDLSAGGLTVRRKKKKKLVEPELEGLVEAAAEAALAEAAAPPARPGLPVSEGAPPAPAAEVEPEPETAEPVGAEEPLEAWAPSPLEAVEPLEPEEAPVLSAEEESAALAALELEAEPAAAEAVEEAEPAPAGAEDTRPALVRPTASRRPGKVVGFVDLSKVQAPPSTRRPESRRLRSKDDVAPDVQPTLGHDRKKALVRGDHASRGQLTASQLREKEAARFLRRKGVTPGAGPRTARPRTSEAAGSPLSGGEVKVEAPVTVKKLADAISVKSSQVLGRAMGSLGLGVNINSTLDEETAALLALEFNVTLKVIHEVQAERALLADLYKKRTEVEEEELVMRPPTVAFLGHVDHGKTTLLDRIRSSRVAQSESGGITQHIGAYQVQTRSGHTVTIIDTPGHEAFTAMRARGAKAVDLVVLVVAADDGVMPSTVEAINHARAAKTPIVVAINKVDKPEANPGKVKQQLTAHNLLSEDFGGETAMIEVSALKGTGVEELLERVFLESEVLELKSHKKGPAQGIVLEAEVQEGKGRVAYLLVKDGTLNRGDIILAGEGYGRVRSIHDDRGNQIESAGPSMPVGVSGLSELPTVGDEFHVVERLEQAREVAEERARKNRAMSLAERRSVTAENLLQAVAEQQKTAINLILKADVQGSLQALSQQLDSLVHEEVDVKLLHSALGTVTESDVNLAATSNGIVMAFRVGVHDKGRIAAERGGVEIRHYDVIYELLDEVRAMMEGTLAPEMTEQVTGHAEVRVLFKSSKFGNIAGSHVIDGVVQRDSRVRLLRQGKKIWEGQIGSLRREKDDVREVREGFDCGIVLRDFDELREGDVVEAFKMVAVKRLLKI
jgi:translation initiation factor IF-2